jgi:hypothetical protein
MVSSGRIERARSSAPPLLEIVGAARHGPRPAAEAIRLGLALVDGAEQLHVARAPPAARGPARPAAGGLDLSAR